MAISKEIHVCSTIVPMAGGPSRGWRHCRKNATVCLAPDNKWYCSVHANKVINKTGSPEKKAMDARIANTRPPLNCKYDICRYNAIQPSENSQECIGCSGLKDLNWLPKR